MNKHKILMPFSADFLSFPLLLVILSALLMTTVTNQMPEEYEVPLKKLGKFMHSMVEPLDVMLCDGVLAKYPLMEHYQHEFCDQIAKLQRNFHHMTETIKRYRDAEIITNLVTQTFSMAMENVVAFNKLLKQHLRNHHVDQKRRQFLFFQSEIIGLCWYGATGMTKQKYELMKQRLNKYVEELKLLQSKGDYASEEAKELVYACVYIGTRMFDKKFLESQQDRIGFEVHWTLELFSLDLLAYKIEFPAIRDLRIELEQEQDGYHCSVLILEDYEGAKALLDHFTVSLLNPIIEKCRQFGPIEHIVCDLTTKLDYYDYNFDTSITAINEKLAELEAKEHERQKPFKRTALLVKQFKLFKHIVSIRMKELAVPLPAQSPQFADAIFDKITYAEKNKLFKEKLAELNKRNQKQHSNNSDTKSKKEEEEELKQLALECIVLHYKIEGFYQSPVQQLYWAMRQFTVSLMAYSVEAAWAREHLPTARKMYSLIELQKAVKLLEKFQEQILTKLKKTICHENRQSDELEKILCKSVFGILARIEELENELKKPYEGVEDVEILSKKPHVADRFEILSKIKYEIFLHANTDLWKHLEEKITNESKSQLEKIKMEVETFQEDKDDAKVEGLKKRFEEKLGKFRKLVQETGEKGEEEKLAAFDCVYTGHWMVIGHEWKGKSHKEEEPFDEIAVALRQFAVDLLVYRIEIADFPDIPDILFWTDKME